MAAAAAVAAAAATAAAAAVAAAEVAAALAAQAKEEAQGVVGGEGGSRAQMVLGGEQARVAKDVGDAREDAVVEGAPETEESHASLQRVELPPLPALSHLGGTEPDGGAAGKQTAGGELPIDDLPTTRTVRRELSQQ